MSARFIVGDVFDGLATLEDGTVDLVVTSPPFLALRSYLPADHPDKHKEIGSAVGQTRDAERGVGSDRDRRPVRAVGRRHCRDRRSALPPGPRERREVMELPDPNSDFGEAFALTWARCPYPADLCGADAVFEPGGVDADDNVTGVVTCHNGHRWSVARLADHGEYVGVEGENP